MPSTRVKGGKKLARFLSNSKRAASAFPVIEVGFLDRHIAVLASRLEFGDPNANLPERPAFRQGIGDLERALPGCGRTLYKARTGDVESG